MNNKLIIYILIKNFFNKIKKTEKNSNNLMKNQILNINQKYKINKKFFNKLFKNILIKVF